MFRKFFDAVAGLFPSQSVTNSVVLASSHTTLKNQFVGCCFEGPDFIIGQRGYEEFRRLRGKSIGPGEDGSYVIATKTSDGAVMGTDFSGYSRLFLYRSGGRWAVGTSFIDLVEWCAAKDWPISINKAHLAHYLMKPTIGKQIASLQTAVDEITLIPAALEVVVSNGSVSTRPTARMARIISSGEDYATVMRRYLATQAARFSTLFRSDMAVSSDLTGGQDSRTVFALILAASKGTRHLAKVDFYSHQSWKDDLRVAQEISSTFGASLNRRNALRKTGPNAASYDLWRSHCLGVYMPVYFASPQDEKLIRVSGAGGEGHRGFYAQSSLDDMLLEARGAVPDGLLDTLKADIKNDIAYLSQFGERSIDPLIIHYRHFRDRFHGGRSSLYGTSISPLASADLRHASMLCSPEHRTSGQIIADIILSVSRDLASIPYDKPAKDITQAHLDSYTDLSGALDDVDYGGRVFGTGQSIAGANDDLMERLRGEFEALAPRAMETGIFPKNRLTNVRSSFDKAEASGGFAHATHARRVSHMIAAGAIVEAA